MVLVAIYRSYLCGWLRKDVRTPSKRHGGLFESIRPTDWRNDSRARLDLLAQEYVVLECLGMAGSSYLLNRRAVTRGRVRCLPSQDRSLRTRSTDTFLFSFIDTCVYCATSVLVPLIGALECQLAVCCRCRPD